MLKKDIVVGGVYVAKVSGKLVRVRVDKITEHEGYKTPGGLYSGRRTVKGSTGYLVTNLTTGRKTTFRSAAKFRSEVKPTPGKNTDFCPAHGSKRQVLANKLREEGISSGVTDETMADMERAIAEETVDLQEVADYDVGGEG